MYIFKKSAVFNPVCTMKATTESVKILQTFWKALFNYLKNEKCFLLRFSHFITLYILRLNQEFLKKICFTTFQTAFKSKFL